jgi:hypothetical protein
MKPEAIGNMIAAAHSDFRWAGESLASAIRVAASESITDVSAVPIASLR